MVSEVVLFDRVGTSFRGDEEDGVVVGTGGFVLCVFLYRFPILSDFIVGEFFSIPL